MSWDDDDFNSPDPFVRFNAHQAAKGRPLLPDPDVARKAQRETGYDFDEAFIGTCQGCGAYWDVRQRRYCTCGGYIG